VCMIHCGEAGKEWKVLHERLRRVEYLAEDSVQTGAEIRIEAYSAILVDEAHLLSPNTLEILLEIGKTRPVIFSSNCEDMISPEELELGAIKLLGEQPGIQTSDESDPCECRTFLFYTKYDAPAARTRNAALSPCRGGLCQ